MKNFDRNKKSYISRDLLTLQISYVKKKSTEYFSKLGTSNRELNSERYLGNGKITSRARGNDLLC
jgi:hypothetical protein